ncbi:hypothetical protein CRM22_002289 [Opisthorchis felineus]|uniref:tRNA (guanine(26)-N(2))-dimethyltransferase n=2 Tax=Opisthorchis felineus TaxID=147828 RepID=A0A4S2M6Q3_OPIFE|nr:hypothetical protein CRM22_002289 [Opisthorchis felineus]
MLTSRIARLLRHISGQMAESPAKPVIGHVEEGKARTILPEGVFYNRVQEFNRDITVAMLQQYQLLHQSEWIARKHRQMKRGAGDTCPTYDGLRILEALSATGIRSVRFALEVPKVSKIVANDLDVRAVELIRNNVELNGVGKHVDVTCMDAVELMHKCKTFTERFNVVDIDPYGTASPFLDSAVQCLHDGGLLCVTSTDAAVLCGSTPGTSMGKYGGLAIKNSAPHETSLRVLLHAIQSAASRFGCVIEPLLSLSVDFYVRVFVRIWASPGSVKAIAAKHAICFSCTGCTAYHVQPLGHALPSNKRLAPARGPPVGPLCAECGSHFNVWGPIWCGPLHSRSFLSGLLTTLGCSPKVPTSPVAQNGDDCNTALPQSDKTGPIPRDPSNNVYPSGAELRLPMPGEFSFAPGLTDPDLSGKASSRFGTFKRIVGMCTMAFEELPDVILYHRIDHLTAVLGMQVPALLELHSPFLNAGYRISCSHTEANTFKTDAPMSFIWDVLVTFHRKFQSSEKAYKSPTSSATSDESESAELKTESGKEESIQPKQARKRTNRQHRRKRLESLGPEQAAELASFRAHRDQVRAQLLSRSINSIVDLTIHPDANPPSRTDGLVRYQPNPEKFWGPKARPKMPKTVSG